MSKLEQLIQQYCPDGVEYRKIGDVAEVGTGSSNGNEAIEDGLYPFFIRSQTIKRKNTYEYDDEAIIIPGEGGIGDIFHYVNGKYALHQRVYRIHFNTEDINVKFVYYYMTSAFKQFIMMKAVSATVVSIRKPMIEGFSIPVPPLPVQEEIVRILDNFTTLTAELQAELQARRRQYEHYRDHLLSFGGSDNTHINDTDTIKQHCTQHNGSVEWKKLGEIGVFYGGLSGKTKEDFKDGNAKFISYKNIFNNLSLNIDTDEKVKVAEGEKQNTIQYGDILFTGSSETPDECGMSSVLTKHTDEKLYLNSFCFGYRLNDISQFSLDFLKHLFRSHNLRTQIGKTASGTTRFNVSKKRFAEVEIPIIPLTEQVRIANILDRFYSLVADITAGLPAEIDARRKQYEYYRDKLLTFPKIEK